MSFEPEGPGCIRTMLHINLYVIGILHEDEWFEMPCRDIYVEMTHRSWF